MNWKHVSLGEISVNIQTGPFGSQLHQSDYSEKGTPVVMPKDLISGHISEESIARVSDDHVERLSRHKIEVGDILYSRRGDVGRCAFASETEAGWLCGTGCLRVTIDSRKANPKFVFYQLLKADTIGWVEKHAVGSTIDDMNTLCSNKGMQIHTIAAIRSEVLRNVRSTGYELTKPIEDRGIEINWFQKGGDYKENQLLTIIENKIHASEQMSGFPPSKDVWKEYFGEDINGEETRKYILNNSLYRPRDIIRMMSAIHNQIGTSEKFTQEAFDKAQQEYSELMWTEIKDELRLSYSEDEVNAIFTLLNRITMPFTYEILSQRIAQLGKFYPRMPELLNSERLTQMLNKLYELGIIGNTGKPMNFVFLGRTALDLLGRMVIHTPLRNYFSVQYER